MLFFALALCSYASAQTAEELEALQTFEENTGYSQEELYKYFVNKNLVKEVDGELVVMDSIKIKKGSAIRIYLPIYSTDFYFVEQKKSLINATNILGAAADAVSVGAVAVGLGSNSLGTMGKSFEVLRKAQAVSYGADALDRVDKLPISKKSKRIAGKEMEVIDWENENGTHIITAKLDNRRYTIELESAFLFGEIKL